MLFKQTQKVGLNPEMAFKRNENLITSLKYWILSLCSIYEVWLIRGMTPVV